MKTLRFHSTLANSLADFVKLRQLGGSDYHSQARLLRYFDQFLCQVQFQGSTLPPNLVREYLVTMEHLHPRTQQNRFSVLRQFCRYLRQLDSRSYGPDQRLPTPAQTSRTAYIFTHEQLCNLLKAARQLRPIPALQQPVYGTLFGLLYTTGLRIGEALALNLEDFDHHHALLHIREGKFRKARDLPLSSSTAHALHTYLHRRLATPPQHPRAPLFLNQRLRRLRYSTVQDTFKIVLRRAGLPHTTNVELPRLHDLRHTFAIHRLLAWYQEGKDLNAYLPALATYLGHVNVSSTQVYLEPTPELLHQAGDRFAKYCREHLFSKGVSS